MNRQPVDLNSHMNLDVIRGGVADFELISTPVMFANPVTGNLDSFDSRTVITRADTGKALSVVSDRYFGRESPRSSHDD